VFARQMLKRAFDAILAAAVLSLCLPLFWAIIIAIRLGEGPGPIFLQEERLNTNGRKFLIWRFRCLPHRARELGAPADGFTA
jgi:AATGal transferase